MKERTDQRVMPFWQVCIVVLALPALVAAVVLAVGIRMHMKDYRRYKVGAYDYFAFSSDF